MTKNPRASPCCKVLLVNHNPIAREALTDLLTEEEHLKIVGSAATSQAAITIAYRSRPDIALVDLDMPDHGGEQVLNELSTHLPQILLIALSALGGYLNHHSVLFAGANHYLLKSAAVLDLLRSLNSR